MNPDEFILYSLIGFRYVAIVGVTCAVGWSFYDSFIRDPNFVIIVCASLLILPMIGYAFSTGVEYP